MRWCLVLLQEGGGGAAGGGGGAPRRATPRGVPSPASKACIVPSTAPTTATRAWLGLGLRVRIRWG